MIRMICGVCRVDGQLKRAADGTFSLPTEQEVHLVNAGVAEFATEWRTERVATPGEGGDNSGQGDDPPERVPDSTELETGESEGGGKDEETAELQEGEVEADDTLEIVDGHFTTESLMELSRANMEKLAADLGVDVKKCRNKSEIAALLSAMEVKTDDGGEDPPELGAEGPVV